MYLKDGFTFFIYVTCSNELYVSELDFEKTLHKHATNDIRQFCLFVTKVVYTLISFLSIGNAYFSFILLPGI